MDKRDEIISCAIDEVTKLKEEIEKLKEQKYQLQVRIKELEDGSSEIIKSR